MGFEGLNGFIGLVWSLGLKGFSEVIGFLKAFRVWV